MYMVFGTLRYAHITKTKTHSANWRRFLPIFLQMEHEDYNPTGSCECTVLRYYPAQLYIQTGKEIYYHSRMWYTRQAMERMPA